MHGGALELTGGAFGAAVTLAQLDAGGDMIGSIAKGGTAVIFGLLLYFLIRTQAKKDEQNLEKDKKVAADLKEAANLLAETHLAAVTKLAAETKDAATQVAKEHREALSFLVAGHEKIVARIETAHVDSATKFEAGTDRICKAVESQVARCAETARVMEAVAHK